MEDDGAFAVEVAVGGLEFGFEADFDFRDIHEFPSGEAEEAAGAAVVGDADEQMAGVVVDFAGGGFGFVVKGAERGGAVFGGVELGVKVGNGAVGQDKAEIGVAAALFLAGGGAGDAAGPAGLGVAAGEEFVLDEAAGFVDAPGGVDGVGGFVEFGEGGVEDGAEAGEPGGIGFRVDGEDFFPAGGGEDFGEGDAGEVAVFLEQPVDELGGVGGFFWRGGGLGFGVEEGREGE